MVPERNVQVEKINFGTSPGADFTLKISTIQRLGAFRVFQQNVPYFNA